MEQFHGELKFGEPFGLDQAFVKQIDWPLAITRIIQDQRTDFIYAPHLAYIYSRAGDALAEQVQKSLLAGTFLPGLPFTIEVPKSYRMRVAIAHRLGPSYSRPGSILLPADRLFYQALADQAVPVVDSKTDKKRCFSHRVGAEDSPNMFLPTRTCWNLLQKALLQHSKAADAKYILKLDVANFFGSINLHTLINTLNDSGYPKGLSSRLEAILTKYTVEKSSRGILQGIFPSDLFGNYYLTPIDKFLSDRNSPSARYVDDIYVFVSSVTSAERLLRELIPAFRSYDLVLNEAKSMIMPKTALMSEEPDLEALFSDAAMEISEQLSEEDFSADYGFQAEWDDEEKESTADLELKATKVLFDSQSEYPGHEENIERFCIPLFEAAGSDYAVQHVLSGFSQRPAMSQIYASYLARFLENANVKEFLFSVVANPVLTDWQRLWALAALAQLSQAEDEDVKITHQVLKDANRHTALRAVAATFVGQFGDHSRRKELSALYPNVTSYLKAAIYYSSRQWPGPERTNAKANWGGDGPLNTLLTIAMAKKK